jgi:hypothetical protein
MTPHTITSPGAVLRMPGRASAPVACGQQVTAGRPAEYRRLTAPPTREGTLG